MSKSEKSKLNNEETRKMLASVIAEVAEAKINALEKAINKEAAPIIHKDDLRIAMSSSSIQAVDELEKKQRKNGQPLDIKTAENFKKEIRDHVDGLLSDTPDLLGNKEQIAAKIKDLRTNINRFRQDNGVDLAEKPKNQQSQKTVSKDDKKKLSSLETWNLLTEKAAKVALNEVNFKENSFKENARAGAMTTEMGNFKKLSLRVDIEKAFDQELTSQSKKYDLDFSTINAFNKNKEAYFKEMLAQTKISGGEIEVSESIKKIRTDIESFKKKTTIDPNDKESGWKKVAEFCESIKMDGLAKFCHEKHAQTVAKDISKELNENLKDHKMFSPESYKSRTVKPKGTDHSM